jgi:hypothetical protein
LHDGHMFLVIELRATPSAKKRWSASSIA